MKTTTTHSPGMMGAHCHACLARFEIPLHPTEKLKCPECGTGQVIDHNLQPLSPEEELAALQQWLSLN